MVERRDDDIDGDWGDGAENPGDRPTVSNAADDEGTDKVDTAKNRLARVDERVRVDSAEEGPPPSRPFESNTVPPPSGYEEVRRTSKRQAFDLDAALERRGLPPVPPSEPTPMPPISPAPPSSSPFFAAGHLPPRPQSTQAPPALIHVVGPPQRSLAPIIGAVAIAFVLAVGIAVYGITSMRAAPPPPPIASTNVAPPPPPSPEPRTEPIAPAVVDTAPAPAPQPTVPVAVPSPRPTTAPSPATSTSTSTVASAVPPPKPSIPSAPAPAHTPSATSTAAPGVEFLKRNL